MNKVLFYFISALMLVGCANNKKDIEPQKVDAKYLAIDIERMREMKQSIEEKKDSNALVYYNSLILEADSILTNSYNYTIVNKKILPPSGDVHDYISMAIYRWPNPDTKDGLPYIVRDGEINPESRTKYTDAGVKIKLCKDIKTLGLAYYYSHDDKYVTRANDIIRCFFINPETKMNPNFNHGQLAPGYNMGRSAGIIESSQFTEVMEGVTLISESEKWPEDTDKQLKKWFSDYLGWLTTSKFGLEARNLKNNHGTNYDKLCCCIYLFLGQYDNAVKHINLYTRPRLKSHIKEDGLQPLEVGRTKSWGYATMNCRTFTQIAVMGERVGADMWYTKDGDKNDLKTMIDWFIPYVTGEKEWKWKQIIKVSVKNIEWPLDMAYRHYKDEKYQDAIKKMHTIHDNIVLE